MTEFWRNSGFYLTTRNSDGFLEISDDLLRAFWLRPEVIPVEESCDNERALHELLMEDPRRDVSESEISAMQDADVRDNYQVLLRFRERLLSADSLEAAYMQLFTSGKLIDIAPLFIDHLAHAITHNFMEDEGNPYILRASELLFREQTVTDVQGQLLLADAEIVEMQTERQEQGHISLVEMAQAPEMARRTVEMDVMTDDNRDEYWQRSEYFNMALDVTFGRDGLDALCRVIEKWVYHFLKVEVEVQPTQQVTDERWVRHVGLDVEATALLNDLYEGLEVSEERNERLLSLFRLNFKNPGDMEAEVQGRPVYLGLCRTGQNRLRMKGQNLLFNLPLASSE